MRVAGEDLGAFARRLAPQVDRVFIAGHQAARPLTVPIAQDAGLPNFGVLVDLRAELLSANGVDIREARSIERYADPEGVTAALTKHIEQGLLGERAGRFAPTGRGREILLALTSALDSGLRSAWSFHNDEVAVAVPLMDNILAAADEMTSPRLHPAYKLKRGGHRADEAGYEMYLWNQVAALRYLRADVHALAWAEVGLTAVEAICLTVLCHTEEPRSVMDVVAHAPSEASVRSSLSALERCGLARSTGNSWGATDAGRKKRVEIEENTNESNAPPFGALSLTAREDLFAALSRIGAP